jgi:hypothetical protein
VGDCESFSSTEVQEIPSILVHRPQMISVLSTGRTLLYGLGVHYVQPASGRPDITAWHDGPLGADPTITGIDRSPCPLSVFLVPTLRIVIISQ